IGDARHDSGTFADDQCKWVKASLRKLHDLLLIAKLRANQKLLLTHAIDQYGSRELRGRRCAATWVHSVEKFREARHRRARGCHALAAGTIRSSRDARAEH